jgi:hypothetical protein
MNGQVSATRAIGQAIEHVRTVLFRPFDLGRWVMLGFIAFLAYLGEGGSSLGYRRGLGSDDAFVEGARSVVTWMMDHRLLTGIILFFAFLIILALVVLFQWLSSRATFVYIDCLATNRAELVRPWREHREIADSYFFWRLIFGLCTGFVSLLLVLPLLISFLSALASGDEMDPWKVLFGSALVFLTIPLLMVVVLVAVLVRLTLREFVAPVQYMNRIKCGRAFRIVLGMIGSQPGAFIIYVLLKILIAIVVFLGLLVLGCATCCIGFCCMAIPVIGQTILQPLFVFLRSFSLFFLQGFGPEFDVFGPGAPGGGLVGPPPPPPTPAPSWGSTPGASTPGTSAPWPASPGPSSAPPFRPEQPPPPESVPLSTWPEAPSGPPPWEPPRSAPPAAPPEPEPPAEPPEPGPPSSDPDEGRGPR